MNIRMQGELPRSSTLKRIAIYGVLIFFAAVAQCSFFPNLRFLTAIPNITVGAVAAVSLFESERVSSVFAISAGFVLDAIGGSGVLLSPIIMLAVSVILSLIARKMLKGFFPYTLILAVASVISVLVTYIRLFISSALPSYAYLFFKLLFPELITTFVFSLPLYIVFRFASKLCESKGKFKM